MMTMPNHFQRRALALALAPLTALGLLATAATAGTAPAPAGDQLFRQRCQSCHAVKPGPSPVGPNLSGVVGRKASSTAFAYSPALKAAGVVWTRANLDKYLSGPAKMVPGTRMAITVTDAAQRKAIIDYLAHAH